MARKSFEIVIEVNIHAVTCPGVWLCQSGKLSLHLFVLNQWVETSKHKPVFPMLIHEVFMYRKAFHNAYNLSDLQRMLQKQNLYIELIQTSDCTTGCVLATFQTPLCNLLYPHLCKRGLNRGSNIDLLMDVTKCFPGIIAPKIEISTKTSIEECLTNCTGINCQCDALVLNPKVLTSTFECKPLSKQRQKCVCHSSKFHGYKYMQESRRRKKRMEKPPFVWRHAEKDLLGFQKCNKPNCSCRYKNTDGTVEIKSCSYRLPHHCLPEAIQSRNTRKSCEPFCCRTDQSEGSKHANPDNCFKHNAENCAVCVNYTRAFDDICRPRSAFEDKRGGCYLNSDTEQETNVLFSKAPYCCKKNPQIFNNCLMDHKKYSKRNYLPDVSKQIHERVENALNISNEYPFACKSMQYNKSSCFHDCNRPSSCCYTTNTFGFNRTYY